LFQYTEQVLAVARRRVYFVSDVHASERCWRKFLAAPRFYVSTRDDLEKLKAQIADTGQYAFETTAEEHAAYGGDQAKIDELFRRLALERVRRWVDMAEDKLSGTGVQCLVSGDSEAAPNAH
jgi:uncharacterized protein